MTDAQAKEMWISHFLGKRCPRCKGPLAHYHKWPDHPPDECATWEGLNGKMVVWCPNTGFYD
jgi:hypothetical protein